MQMSEMTTTTTTTTTATASDADKEKNEMREVVDAPALPSATAAAAAVSPSMVDLSSLIPAIIPTSLSTTGLEHRLRQLREASTLHSQVLTQKLATSQSGQNLLHMGTSLSTLPPDLTNMLSQLQPFLATVDQTEKDLLSRLQTLVSAASKVQQQARRVQQANAAANLYADLVAAERVVKKFIQASKQDKLHMDDVASLERPAHITTCLLADLNVANEQIRHVTTSNANNTAMRQSSSSSDNSNNHNKKRVVLPNLRTMDKDDTEAAQFLLKLAPRIRQLEQDTVQALLQAMEDLLLLLHKLQANKNNDTNDPQIQSFFSEEEEESSSPPPPPPTRTLLPSAPNSANLHFTDINSATTTTITAPPPTIGSSTVTSTRMDRLLPLLGHVMRGLAILGRGSQVESIFARVAIMPLIRSKVSMGRLDEGGSRGECAGLWKMLDDMATDIANIYGPILRLAETMFYMERGYHMNVDLLTAGVWIPIATALMADTAIKMAIFSPGIASILQANYVAVDTFLSELAERLLTATADNGVLTMDRIRQAQERIYLHEKTAEFLKKWNLPIYYQLRFGESCNRLNRAIDLTRREGWIAQVFTGTESRADEIKNNLGFELLLFVELYDILTSLWRPDVILKPLANRFLRGAVQLLGRTVAFIQESMEGKIKFGAEDVEKLATNQSLESDNNHESTSNPPLSRAAYCWGDSEDDIAAVAWELDILATSIRKDYAETVCEALVVDGLENGGEAAAVEIKSLVTEVLQEAADQIYPIITKAWDEMIVNLLIAKCSAPLSAVKGVAVMYRMTNRPPPTQPSSFVGTIFRPLKEFAQSFSNRTPANIGTKWKQVIVMTVSERYAVAVDELLTTVQKTEVALKNRKANRRVTAGGMSDGEKLKLQLYLDYLCYKQMVQEMGIIDVVGLSKLKELTAEGEALQAPRPANNGTYENK